MRPDPHETAERRPEYAKDDRAETVLAAVNERLASAELPLARDDALPVVYVVGAPRSGTTLAHQLLARHLPLGYVDNVVARFWGRPAVGAALSRTTLGEPGTRSFALESSHGTTAEPAGPHEFGYFWRRWLGLDDAPTHHLDETAQARVDRTGLGGALAELRAAWGAPLVFKNVICGFHARMLAEVHERSLFVHVVRETEAVARSILRSRLERYGSYDAWWSLKPSTWPFDGPPAAQVVAQALDCRGEIAAELDAVPHALRTSYEALCAAPAAFVEQVAAALAGLGGDVQPGDGMPAELRASSGPRLPAELERELHAQLRSRA